METIHKLLKHEDNSLSIFLLFIPIIVFFSTLGLFLFILK